MRSINIDIDNTDRSTLGIAPAGESREVLSEALSEGRSDKTSDSQGSVSHPFRPAVSPPRSRPAAAPQPRKRAKPAPKRAAHRPTLCTPEVTRTLCDYLRMGLSLRQIQAKPGMPSASAVFEWLGKAGMGSPYSDFANQYARARGPSHGLRRPDHRAGAEGPARRGRAERGAGGDGRAQVDRLETGAAEVRRPAGHRARAARAGAGAPAGG
jgi:hypothetical protein